MNVVLKQREIYLALGICSIAIFGLWLLDASLDATIWEWLESNASMDRFSYCETKEQTAFLRQKVNVYTNVIYLFSGVLIFLISRRLSKANVQFSAILPYFLSASLIYLFFSSSFFHAAFIKIGQRLDVNATDAVLIAFSSFAINRKYEDQKVEGNILLACLLAILACFVLFYFISGKIIFGTLSCILAYYSFQNYKANPSIYDLRLLITSFVFFGDRVMPSCLRC